MGFRPASPRHRHHLRYVKQWAESGNGYSWANNLVHERVHAYGQVHVGRYSEPNKCDLAYVAGNLAEAILRSTASGGPLPADSKLCPALTAELRAGRMMM